jgi:hypothetical protein
VSKTHPLGKFACPSKCFCPKERKGKGEERRGEGKGSVRGCPPTIFVLKIALKLSVKPILSTAFPV